MLVTGAKMIHPDRSINNNHDYFVEDLRLGMAFNSFSVPPSLASRLLLSRAIKASSPSRTKAVFSEIPVRREAFSNILSSIFNVVLICIMMHHLCIHVNSKSNLKIKKGNTCTQLRQDKGVTYNDWSPSSFFREVLNIFYVLEI